jgi:hypothetical protein
MLHLRLIILSVGDNISVESETLLVTNFINLKIKPAQSFGDPHRGRMYVRVFIGMIAYTCMSICVCTMFLKKSILQLNYPICSKLFRSVTSNYFAMQN